MAAKQTQQAKGKAGKPPEKLQWKKAPEQGELKFWEPRAKGDTLSGPILSIGRSQYGPIYKIRDEKKGILSLKNWSYLTNQLQRIEEEDGTGLKAGDHVKVTFTGMGKSANGEFFMFDVEYARTVVPF